MGRHEQDSVWLGKHEGSEAQDFGVEEARNESKEDANGLESTCLRVGAILKLRGIHEA